MRQFFLSLTYKLHRKLWTQSQYSSAPCRRLNKLRSSSYCRSRLILAGLFLTVYALNFAMLRPVLALDNGCSDVQFVFARGSGELLGGPSNTAWQDAIQAELAGSSLKFNFYELGSQKISGYQYPAVAVSGDLNGISNLLGAYVSGGAAFDFGASVQQGQSELKAFIEQISASCPQTKFVLGGYSQGAMLVSGLLDQLDSTKIAYVATFGDPKLYLPEGELKHSHTSNRQPSSYRQIPEACLGKNLSSYREHVPDCYAYEGVLGSYRPYQPAGYQGKLGTWCNDRDIMCSSGFSISDHTAYVSTHLYEDAARVIVDRLSTAFPNHVVITTNTATTSHDVAVLIDSTSSMSSLIDHYKTEAKNLAERVLTSGGRIALFEFRDLKDPFQTRRHCDFSCTLEEFSERIDAIRTDAGGDEPESALSALLTTMNSLAWKSGVTKSIVLLTDASYLSPDRDGTTLNQVVLRSLEIDPVNIYFIGPAKLGSKYTELTSLTGGQIFSATTELELSTESILGRPVAKMALSEYAGSVGSEFVFDASGSHGINGGGLNFDWDLDGDGVFELSDAGAVVRHVYDEPISGFVQVRAREGKLSSTMSAKLTVSTSNQIKLPTISELSVVPLSETSVRVSFRTDADKVLLVIDDAIMGFLPAGQRDFTLGELTKKVELTLIPYANNDRKGISRTLKIDPVLGSVSDSDVTVNLTIPTVPNTGLKL